MNFIRFGIASLLVALSGYPALGIAEDIDIYSDINGSGTRPNVLIILDNAANFSANAAGRCTYADGGTPSLSGTLAGIEQCAIYNAIYSLPLGSLNLGIMVYNGSGILNYDEPLGEAKSDCQAVRGNGGCLIMPLTELNATKKANMLAWIRLWELNNIKTNGQATAQAMQEAWAYYAGTTGISGRDYASIKPAAGCQANFVIFIGNAYASNGTPGDGGLGNLSLKTELENAPGITTEQKANIFIPKAFFGPPDAPKQCGEYTMGTHSDSSGLYADEWARYMTQKDLYTGTGQPDGHQNITTYTIGALGASCKPDYPAVLNSMANVGGGKYYATNADNSDEIKNAILSILNEVQAVNSAFSSSSLPVSVNAQGTYLNQIFMGMFRPTKGASPKWQGNLKQYQFLYDKDTKTLKLGDSLKKPAINSAATGTDQATGFISPNAVSFWTKKDLTTAPDINGGFWINQKSGSDPNDALNNPNPFDYPDGEIVEKGGAAQHIRLRNLLNSYADGSTSNTRALYTYCPGGADCETPSKKDLTDSTNAFIATNNAISDSQLGTGARTVSSITTQATVTATSAKAGDNITITAFARSGDIVTATVSPADIEKIGVGTLLHVASSIARFNCDPCTVNAVDGNTFQYAGQSGGPDTVPSTPLPTKIMSTTVVITKANHGLSIGKKVTFKANSCTVLTSLNGTIRAISDRTVDSFTVTVPTPVNGMDTACQYTPNAATVTTAAAHGFPSNESITIAGATPTGFNGTWTITATGANTFTYDYSTAAPIANFSGTASATGNTTREKLINWIRGFDDKNDEKGPGGSVTVRPSVHGDVLHSRPVVINYGGPTGVGVVVFYGANDGVFRAINGKQTAAIGDVPPGGELWGFIPSEFFGKLKRLRDNSPMLDMPTTPAGIVPAPQKKDYFVDGPSSTYQKIKADGETTDAAHVYVAMRRGGRFLYALDVTTPTAPKIMWRRKNTDTDFGGIFSELGQTWSQPKVARVKGHANPVLIFGGGYDPAEDSQPPAANTMGRGIYILDAITGDPVWRAAYTSGTSSCDGNAPTTTTAAKCHRADMKYSIPADITLVDRDRDGYIERLYAVDMGGNVWRADLEVAAGHAPENWQVRKFAELGCDDGACGSGATPRKFFYPADVIPVGIAGTSGSYDAVIAGSGDREHPLQPTETNGYPEGNSAYDVVNKFYMLKDPRTGKNYGDLDTDPGPDVIRQTAASPNGLFNASTTLYDQSVRGYYFTLRTGEKVVNAPTTVAGTTYFGTNTPKTVSQYSCTSNLGTARSYGVTPLTAKHASVILDGGGLPPTPVAGVVQITDDAGNVTDKTTFCLGCGDPNLDSPDNADCRSAIGACKPPYKGSKKRTRTYWYQK